MSAINKNIATLLRQEIWNTGNFAIADEICADDAVFHNNDPLAPDFGQGPQALKQLVTMYRDRSRYAQGQSRQNCTHGQGSDRDGDRPRSYL